MTWTDIYHAGQAAMLLAQAATEKSADCPELSYGLAGKLYLSTSGWLLLSVPNALGRGAFDALEEHGVELPTSKSLGRYNAHISVMSPEEVEKLGGPEAISERGHSYTYTLGPVRCVAPDQNGVSKVWFIEVKSPDLEKLRKSYGLPALPFGDHQFHITFAQRRRAVLHANEISKLPLADSFVELRKAASALAVLPSTIEGRGLHATRPFKAGELIKPDFMKRSADIDGVPIYHQSVACRFTNHADNPNIFLSKTATGADLYALHSIKAGEELAIHYGEASLHLGNPFRYYFLGQPYAGGSGTGRASVFDETAKTAAVADDVAAQIAAARERVEAPKSQAQAEAGNYRKGHVAIQGLNIAIENPKGSTRSGTSKSGKKWSVEMKHDYGYIKGTIGRDKDHIDVFLGPDPTCELVFVVDQIDPETGKFDEHKVLLGFHTEEEARDAYSGNYSSDWRGLGNISSMTMSQFKEWLAFGNTTKPVKAAGESVPTIAVDLDGTITDHGDWRGEDTFHPVRDHVKDVLDRQRQKGRRIVVHTVRGHTDKIKKFLDDNKIPYDHINENPDQPDGSSHKVVAHVYVDDRAVDGRQDWLEIEKEIDRRLAKSAASGVDEVVRVASPAGDVGQPQRESARVVMPLGDAAQQGYYLLERLKNRQRPKNLNKIRFPGGGLEPGESPQRAAARELLEELGVVVDPKKLEYLTQHRTDRGIDHYLQWRDHGLSPGRYIASKGGDPVIHLEAAKPEGADYMGIPLAELFKPVEKPPVKSAVAAPPNPYEAAKIQFQSGANDFGYGNASLLPAWAQHWGNPDRDEFHASPAVAETRRLMLQQHQAGRSRPVGGAAAATPAIPPAGANATGDWYRDFQPRPSAFPPVAPPPANRQWPSFPAVGAYLPGNSTVVPLFPNK